MKTRKLNVVSILIFVVLIGVIAAGFWTFKPDPEPPELMFIAKPLVNTKEWSSINPNTHAPTAMRWINDEEVVFLEKQPNGPYYIYRQKVLPVGQAGGRTLIPNATIPADASIPSPGLNSKNGLVWILASSQSANAIRKFQLANPHKKFTPTRQVGVTLLDRTQSDSSTVQMNDSELLTQVDNALYAVDSWGDKEIRVKPISSNKFLRKFNYSSGLGSLSLLGKSSEKRLIFGNSNAGTIFNYPQEPGIGKVNFPYYKTQEFDLDHPEAKEKSYSIRLPEATVNGGSSLSPIGGRILFNLRLNKTSLIDRIIHKFYAPYRIRDNYEQAWIVSRLDGSEMRTVCKMKSGKGPEAYQWTPDGKHISFIKNGKLYLIDVK